MRIRNSRTLRTVAALAAVSLIATACGGDDDDSSDEPTDTEAPEPAADTTDAPAEEPAAEPADDASGETIRLWLNGGDTPDEFVEFAIAKFNEIHPDVEVQFERQQWTGIVEKLTTALSSSDSPDLVEFGNTQAQAFEAAGAVADLTAHQEELGGDDLLQSLLEAGTYDGRLFGVP